MRQQRMSSLPDNHKRRRHFHKLSINAGYQAHILKVEPNGRKYWYYTRTLVPPRFYEEGK